MPLCPRGHQSTADDYCDECGVAISGTAGATGTPASRSGGGGAATSGVAGDAGDPGAGGACPDCGAARTGRFCESCGHDFVAAGLSAAPPGGAAPASGADVPALPGTAVPPPPGVGTPPPPATTGAAATTGVPEIGVPGIGVPETGVPETGVPEAGVPGIGAPETGAPSGAVAAARAGSGRAGPGRFWLVATADAAYHARMRAAAEPDAEQVALPAFCPERRFPLAGTQVLVGRRSRSRGIEPEIDLTGPPEDAGVSHAHAMLVAPPEGGWAVVDLGSANGTYRNESTEPIEPHTPVPLSDGDRVHVGAWTTLTLRRSG